MAGVQLPTLKRLGVADPTSVGRISGVEVPNASKEIEKTGDALEGLAGKAANYMFRVEQEAADNEAARLDKDYQIWDREIVYGDPSKGTTGIKHQTGADPTDLWKTHRENSEKKRLELMESIKDKDPRLKAVVERRLLDRKDLMDVTHLSDYGHQNSVYQQNNRNSTLEMEKINLIEGVRQVVPGDEKSFHLMDAAIDKMNTAHIAYGKSNGAIERDEKGAITKVGASVEYEMGQSLSEGITSAIDNALDSDSPNKLEIANALKDRYGKFIVDKAKGQLAEKMEKVTMEQETWRVAGMPAAKRDKYLEKYTPEKRAQIKADANKINNDDERVRDDRKERGQKQAKEAGLNVVMELKKNGYITETQAVNHPKLKRWLDKMDPEDKAKVLHAAVTEKYSRQESKLKIQELKLGANPDFPEGLVGMTPVQALEFTPGLSEVDQNRFAKAVEDANTETGAETERRTMAIQKSVEAKLIGLEYLNKDQFQRLSDPEQILKQQAFHSKLTEELAKQPPGAWSQSDQDKFAVKFATDMATEKAFVAPERKKFVASKEAAPAPLPAQPVGGKSNKEWAVEFYKSNKRWPDLKTQELQNFIKAKSK